MSEPIEPLNDSPANGSKPRRTATAIRLRPELHERLTAAADERDISVNWLVNRAVERLLDRLIPVSDWKLTRDD